MSSPSKPLRRIVAALCLIAACSSPDPRADSRDAGAEPASDARLFTLLPASVTGVEFENALHETNERNVFTYRNYYNGGGVGIADLNGDGLPEIVLTSNEEGPRLFLNRGHFRFIDVTRQAGWKNRRDGWTTGVAIADANGDGRLDVYICHAGPVAPEKRANELWINQGNDKDGVPTFEEKAEAYGVADRGYSTQAVFLDYDRDGDLDLFVVNNSPRPVTSFGTENTRHVRDAYGGAKLYRNDSERSSGKTTFTDVSGIAGIHSPAIAFGLGVAVSDVNRDGWPDIYVGNDFFERDYLYVNNRDGTFTDIGDRAMSVMSYFSMGLDIADLDNDGWPDVYTTDMLPEDEYRLKTTTSFESWESYQAKVRNGYHHQLSRNMLQRNNHDGTFSDVGQLAGVARTDWTWSALIADLDLDGRKDIFVTNGMAKDITSQDYLTFLASDKTLQAATSGGRGRVDFTRLTKAMSATPLANYAFRNLGGAGELRFENAASMWGLDTPTFSSGAAYGDLDGDGAPDLVVNNVNQPAFIYRNNARRLHPEHHVLRLRLEGQGANRFGVGARVTAFARSDAFMQEQNPARGFQSSVDYVLDIGVGRHDTIDSIRVDWPRGGASVLKGPPVNQLVVLRETAMEPVVMLSGNGASRLQPPASRLISDTMTLDFRHKENDFVDFDRERLIPRMLSTEGPALAVGDVNGDGLDDVFIGGAKEQAGRLLIQQRGAGARFVSRDDSVFAADAISEDVGAVFFDANGDGAPDLYVVSGGSEYSDRAPALQDRLYLNDGRGNFRKAEGALPAEYNSGSRVAAADYDGDGDVDLFVGGRVAVWRYGVDATSMLLRNDGRGHFTDVTAEVAPGLANVGMVTDAIWRDVDGDGRVDLVIVGEWMPITIFRNVGGGKLQRVAARGLEKSDGWWNRIIAADVTGDGRVDFVVGNLGLNSPLQASDSEPVTMLVKDFDGNGFVEQIVSSYRHGVSYPIALRDELLRTLPFLRDRFATYRDYARKTAADIFTPEELRDATVKRAYTFATSIVRNNGDGSFTIVPLPQQAQVAPVYAILAEDVDGDGKLDLLLAGNFDAFKPEIGRMSASVGLTLKGDGKGGFAPIPAFETGFVVPGQARDARRVRTRGGAVYVVARNNDRPIVFRPAVDRRAAR